MAQVQYMVECRAILGAPLDEKAPGSGWTFIGYRSLQEAQSIVNCGRRKNGEFLEYRHRHYSQKD